MDVRQRYLEEDVVDGDLCGKEKKTWSGGLEKNKRCLLVMDARQRYLEEDVVDGDLCGKEKKTWSGGLEKNKRCLLVLVKPFWLYKMGDNWGKRQMVIGLYLEDAKLNDITLEAQIDLLQYHEMDMHKGNEEMITKEGLKTQLNDVVPKYTKCKAELEAIKLLRKNYNFKTTSNSLLAEEDEEEKDDIPDEKLHYTTEPLPYQWDMKKVEQRLQREKIKKEQKMKQEQRRKKRSKLVHITSNSQMEANKDNGSQRITQRKLQSLGNIVIVIV
ncbi:hypothetical protein L1987_01744 [Smallanthus sonchifolius]|uniref:Uncharacterized protein n=1 Tax=Smallanthus sonchifolius TaxID=185202 RepID=A0ACB9K5Z8_9ASTR|nr:hypothetical protein L1987_01744 [Smallanthus sonchifolius]